MTISAPPSATSVTRASTAPTGRPPRCTASTDPRSPEKYKREVAWSYSQGAPGVFAGDLNYYNIEHDLRETAHLIDTARCPVYIMNGEYDPSTGFKEGEELAAKINGAVWVPMPGIGHFPMTEDYPTMKPFLMPVLDEIAAHGRG